MEFTREEINAKLLREAELPTADPEALKALERKEKRIQTREVLEDLKNRRLLEEELSRAKANLPKNVQVEAEDDRSATVEKLERQTAVRARKLEFINRELSQLITLVGSQQIMVVGATTGRGKSTAVANIAASLLKQGKKVLVIANEEPEENVCKRIACLQTGISLYGYNHSKLSPSQVDKVHEAVRNLTNLKVIDLSFKDNPLWVTSHDGLTKILETLIPKYDVVIIDYYQNVKTDSKNTGRSYIECQDLFNTSLDALKNRFNVPIIVFAQIKPETTELQEFWQRISGRKTLVEKATLCVEIVADKNRYLTTFIVRKDREFDQEGYEMEFGFDRELGTYVAEPRSDADFQMKVSEWKAQAAASGKSSTQDRKVGEAKEKAKEVAQAKAKKSP